VTVTAAGQDTDLIIVSLGLGSVVVFLLVVLAFVAAGRGGGPDDA
jgi:hypothetical protein